MLNSFQLRDNGVCFSLFLLFKLGAPRCAFLETGARDAARLGSDGLAPLLPGVGAVVVEGLEVLPGDELAAVDSGLDGSEPPQDADLFHVADHRRDLQALELGVDRVQPPDQVLEEQVESLREADELAAVHRERGHLGAPQLDHFALVVLRRVLHGRWGGVDGLGGQGHPGAAGGHQVRPEWRCHGRRGRGGRGRGRGGADGGRGRDGRRLDQGDRGDQSSRDGHDSHP